MFFKKPKKEPPKTEYIPVDVVQRLAGQGYSEADIISQLRQQGFTPSQIDKALTGALKSKIGGPQPPVERRMPQQRPPERVVPGPIVKPVLEPLELSKPPSEFTFEEKPEEFTEKPEIPKKEEIGPEITLEEVIEGVVSERWSQFEERLNRFDQRDMQIQIQIEEVRKKVDGLEKKEKESEHTFVSKLDEFGEHVSGIEGMI
jgi:DNA-binding transcriptional MerR regulator